MITNEEINNYVGLMNWARNHDDIRTIRVQETKGLYSIRSIHTDDTVAEGSGFTLTEAMEIYNSHLNKIELIRKTMQ